MPNAGVNRLGLTQGQCMALVGTGIALWAVAAGLLRAIAPMGALEGSARLITYTLVIPGTFPFVVLTRKLIRLRQSQTAVGIAIVTGTALLIDGIVVGWFPQIYSEDVQHTANCAAAILWGAGMALVLGFMMNKGDEQ